MSEKKKHKFMRDLYQIYAQCIFAESKPYYQTTRISRSDVNVVLCLTKQYAINNVWRVELYRGADKSLVLPTSRCILFDGVNISFDASLVIYINSTNISPIMIINRLYETQNLLSL